MIDVADGTPHHATLDALIGAARAELEARPYRAARLELSLPLTFLAPRKRLQTEPFAAI